MDLGGTVIQTIPRVYSDETRLRLQLWLAVLVWSLLVMLLLLWTLSNEDEEMLQLARQEAIDIFNKDQTFRAWGASHGGVYVPVSPVSYTHLTLPTTRLV